MTAPNEARPRAGRRLPLTWIGILPFAIFVGLFLFAPTLKIVIGAFQTQDGAFTFQNIVGLFTPSILSSYWISIKISFWVALWAF